MIGVSSYEEEILPPPSLFSWLREVKFYMRPAYPYEQYNGYKLFLQPTFSNNLYEKAFGNTHEDLTVASVEIGAAPNSDVYRMDTTANVTTNGNASFQTFTFNFAPSGTSQTVKPTNWGETAFNQGFPCRTNMNEPCDPCITICKVDTVDPTLPCNSTSLYSHRLAWISGYFSRGVNVYHNLRLAIYGWTHVSADENNLIDANKITQIPAVKGSSIRGDASVVKGPGSTGGNLVSLRPGGSVTVKVTIPVSDTAQSYQIRLRYANDEPTLLRLFSTSEFEKWYSVQQLPVTYLGEELLFQSFANRDLNVAVISAHEKEYILELTFENLGDPNGEDIITNPLIDKIEFIPIEESLEAFKANQDLEKARKAVNALFTGDAKCDGFIDSVAKFEKT